MASRSFARSPSRARGVTLVEVLISTAILGIIFAGITGALIANQEQYGIHASVAEMQSTLRLATAHLERSIGRAGYGIDPSFAIDTWELNADGTEVAGGARDANGPFDSDELVLHFRDPLFEASVTSADDANLALTLLTPDARPLEAGERLLVLCGSGLGAAEASAYVTVRGAVVAGNAVTVTLQGASASLPPFNENALLAGGCMNDGQARAYRVERRHYFIAWLASGPGRLPRPALMLSRGTDRDGNGTVNELPDDWQTPDLVAGGGSTALGDAELLAFDVEQLQIAYLMNEPTQGWKDQFNPTSQDSDQDWVFGNDPDASGEAPRYDPAQLGLGATAIIGDPSPPRLDTPRTECLLNMETTRDPTDGCGYGAKRRYTNHPGNIRAVRVSLVARSSREDPKLPATNISVIEDGPLENYVPGAAPAPSRHRRQRLQTTVALKNMLQQKHFLEGGSWDVAAAPPVASP